MKTSSIYLHILFSALALLVVSTLACPARAATPQLRAGAAHTVILRSDGTIWSSGSNASGQLGDGSGSNLRKAPVQVGLPGNGAGWSAVAAGQNHNLALKADGSLWAWGANGSGQLGDGSTVDRRSPVRVGSGNSWTAVAAGGTSSFALKADGTLWAWGGNGYGQLGNGDPAAPPADRNQPVQVLNPGGSPFVAVAAGAQHALAIQADGSLWGWGANPYGQAGLDPADTAAHPTPVQIGFDYDWKAIAAGGEHSLALKADGTLWGWGRNNLGQAGAGASDASPHPDPVQVGTGSSWVAIAAGQSHSLGVKRNGTLWGWGENLSGQLGDGTNTDHSAPVRISILSDGRDCTDIVAVAAGGMHSLALKADGELYAWGANGYGQLGDGSVVGSFYPVPTATDAISWIGSEPGGQFSAARRSDGTLWTWGDNSSGQLGYATAATVQTVPGAVGTGKNWIAQATGWTHVVAVKADGTLWGWGDNSSGQLGNGSTDPSPIPRQITATSPASVADNWSAAIAAGDFHTLALKADGTLWAWGDNTSGQLGDGSTVSRSLPVQIPAVIGNKWVAVAAGGAHSMGVQSDGTLWTWGDNSFGQLGDPTLGVGSDPPFSATPQQIVNFLPPTTGYNSSWVAVAAGLNHSLALQADGTLWAWGGNFSGQLGNGNAADQSVPVQVANPGTSPYVAAAAGDSYSVARQADGSLWSWGNNTSGQLGNGVTDATPAANATPLRENTHANDWFGVGSGGSHTVALKADGTLWSWGSNGNGELGDGTTVSRSVPAPLTEARLDVTPEALAYNSVAIGAESLQIITVSNEGSAALTVSSLTPGGPDGALFGVKAGGTCNTVPFTLAPGASCTVAVAFTAGSPGGAKEAVLRIASSDPVSPVQTVDLSGMAGVQHTINASVYQGAPAGSGTISPSGPVLVLDGTSQTFTITPNAGYHVTDVTVDGVSKGAVTSVTLQSVKADAPVVANFAINSYTITRNAANGTVAGPATVNYGSTAIYTIAPAVGYHLADVTVDGVSQGAVTQLTLPGVTANKVITATFVINSYQISASADARGTLSPSGNVLVNHGAGQTFTFTPSPGYSVVDVIVDGVSQGSLPSFTFANVTYGSHSIRLISIPDGDLNGDGKVDIGDALQALRIVVGLVVPTAVQVRHGDVAPLDHAGIPVPDATITVQDALLIIRKVVGLTSGF